MGKNYLNPEEITNYTIDSGIKKIDRRCFEVLLMSILAGMYIAMGAVASSTVAHDISNAGIAKLLTGLVFPIGLMFVVINGADLFTGNCLIFASVLERRVSIDQFFTNLAIVLLGNFIGAVTIAWMQSYGGAFTMSNNKFGAYVILTALSKTNIEFTQAFVLGIMCNLFVCAGVWMMYSSTDVTGKILAGFFSILAFVISGSEHIVANMYYIPAGIFASKNSAFVAEAGLRKSDLLNLTWHGFLLNNAIPVIIGNLVGGMIIATIYHTIYKKFNKKTRCITFAKRKVS